MRFNVLIVLFSRFREICFLQDPSRRGSKIRSVHARVVISNSSISDGSILKHGERSPISPMNRSKMWSVYPQYFMKQIFFFVFVTNSHVCTRSNRTIGLCLRFRINIIQTHSGSGLFGFYRPVFETSYKVLTDFLENGPRELIGLCSRYHIIFLKIPRQPVKIGDRSIPVKPIFL